MNTKPIIGIAPNYSYEKKEYTLSEDYVLAIEKAGGCPIVLLPHQALPLFLDGLLLTGGGDIDPLLFGEEPLCQSGEINPLRDACEMRICETALEKDLPMLGICRGMQVVNVAYGGNMIQDIPSQTKSVQAHVGSMDDRDEPFHWVDLKEGSVIRQLMGTDKIMTNSFHHQAVKDIARGFTVTGTAADGIAEAMECMDKKILCVQFHPENMAQRFGDFVNLFRWLVDNCQ